MQRTPDPEFLAARSGSTGMRLRTLILLRWMAITGQIAAIAIADRYFGLILPLGLCYMAVGLSIIANLVCMFILPENRRLSEVESLLMLLFDTAQLAFLIAGEKAHRRWLDAGQPVGLTRATPIQG